MFKSLLPSITLIQSLLVVSGIPLVPRNESSSPVYNPDLPNVLILGTGGTIAGSQEGTGSIGYEAGSLGVEVLLEAVPELVNVSNIESVQVSNIGSTNMNQTVLLELAKLSNEALCSEDSKFDGVVITHGTDTTEETAFFMDLTVNCGKPVIVTAAMRPASGLAADGPANLLEAVTLAGSPEANDRGAMIVLNDRICSAYYCRKAHANFLDTFRAVEEGNLGGFLNYKPYFYYKPSQPTFKKTFDAAKIEYLPPVDIVHSSQEFRPRILDAAIEDGVKGIVFAGTGAGGFPDSSLPSIEAAYEKGIPVIASTKTGSGMSFREPQEVNIAAGILFASHARIQLQLALGIGMNIEEIRSLFEDQLLQYIGEF